jgi:hypothetical protein
VKIVSKLHHAYQKCDIVKVQLYMRKRNGVSDKKQKQKKIKHMYNMR